MLVTRVVLQLWGRIEARLPQGRQTVDERWMYTDAFSSVVLITRPTSESLFRFLEWFDPGRSCLRLSQDRDLYAPFQLVTLSVVDQLVRWDDEEKANQFVGHLIDMCDLVLRLYNLVPAQISPGTIYNVLKFLELAYVIGVLDVAMLRNELVNIKRSGGIPDAELCWYDFPVGKHRREHISGVLESLVSLAFGRG
ncbi:hypothetical protein H6758_03400 [Candidatus Nomurabacteria bacterium]|nr:hypothetical protein [Candidatus Nomurabacteria bacterium]